MLGFHRSIDENGSILGCYMELTGQELLTFHSSILPPHSGTSSERKVTIYQHGLG
jgi:hypothetical protein